MSMPRQRALLTFNDIQVGMTKNMFLLYNLLLGISDAVATLRDVMNKTLHFSSEELEQNHKCVTSMCNLHCMTNH